MRVEDKRQGPPRLHDLPSLQQLCSARLGWPAARTLDVAQELYDGQGKKVITYPRAKTRYRPESLIPDAPPIVAGLRLGQAFSEIPMPEMPVIRRGASGDVHDNGLGGASHHAVIPNVNTVDTPRDVWPRLSRDERRAAAIRRDRPRLRGGRPRVPGATGKGRRHREGKGGTFAALVPRMAGALLPSSSVVQLRATVKVGPPFRSRRAGNLLVFWGAGKRWLGDLDSQPDPPKPADPY